MSVASCTAEFLFGPHQSSAAPTLSHVAVAGGLTNPEKHFSEQVLNAADQYRSIGLQELLIRAAVANGYDARPGERVSANLSEIFRYAFADSIQAAGFSTVSLPTTFSNIANKFLLEGWMQIDSTWQNIASIVPVNDFKTRTSFSLTGGSEYALVPRGGDILHGELGEVVYTNKADTYARMFSINRTDIVNDDLGALTSVPRRLGRGAALALNKIFWAAYLNNSSFFTSGHNNVSTGGGSALGLAGLQAAEAVFLKQTDPDGEPLGILPMILLVPVELKATALSLMNSEFTIGATGTVTPGGNPFKGRFDVQSSPYMSNAAFTGYSAAAWYLLAAPAALGTVEVCFLNGRASPVVETAEADFGTLGIQMRGYHDFGVSMHEYRGGVRRRWFMTLF